MGWFKRRNITRDWRATDTPPMLDLDALALSGVECGDPADGLSLLGPGEPGFLDGEFVFPEKGVTLDIHGGDLRGIHAHIRPTAEQRLRGVRPFAGAVCHRGAALDPLVIDEATAVTRFGDPDVVEENDGRKVFTYLTDGSEWELVFGAGRRLEVISLY